MRYGDDFILIMDKSSIIRSTRAACRTFLTQELSLSLHGKNDIIISSKNGIKFLGHLIYPDSPLSVDKYMMEKIASNFNYINAASYTNSHLPKRKESLLPWLLKP